MKQTTIDEPIRLEAESIITFEEQDVGSDERIFKVVLFRPTEATKEMLFHLDGKTMFGGMSLIDKWDDGTVDTHTSHRRFEYIGYDPQAGYKQHTLIVKFYMYFGIRL
jgi:hypothetical protein